MKQLLLEVSFEDQLNISYGLDVMANLGLHHDFLYGVVIPYVLSPDSDSQILILLSADLAVRISRVLSAQLNNPESVIRHYVHIFRQALYEPLRRIIQQFKNDARLNNIEALSIRRRNNEIFVGIQAVG